MAWCCSGLVWWDFLYNGLDNGRSLAVFWSKDWPLTPGSRAVGVSGDRDSIAYGLPGRQGYRSLLAHLNHYITS